MRRVLKAGALLTLVVSTSGCTKEATGQTVAVVNGEEISQPELNSELQMANVPSSADKKAVIPQLLQRVVDRKLLAQAAVEQGLDRSPDYLTRQRRMNEELLIGLMSERMAASIKIPSQAEVDGFIASNPGMFLNRSILTLSQLQFDPPADTSVLARLKDDHSLEAVAATLSKLGITFTRSSTKMDTAKVPTEMLKQIEQLPAGEPFVLPSGGKIFVSVIAGREVAPTSPEANRKLAAEALRGERINEAMTKRLEALRAGAKIDYQAGFAPKQAASKQASK